MCSRRKRSVDIKLLTGRTEGLGNELVQLLFSLQEIPQGVKWERTQASTIKRLAIYCLSSGKSCSKDKSKEIPVTGLEKL
jgi:hypothetical protein